MKHLLFGALLVAGLYQDTAAPAPNDYSDPKAWLCRPGRKGDACDIDETATVVAADGKLTRETWTADPNAAIDCFYVYPTISNDPGLNSDMIPGPEEKVTAATQFARVAANKARRSSSGCRSLKATYGRPCTSVIRR